MSGTYERKRKFFTKSPSEVTNLYWKVDNFQTMVDLEDPLAFVALEFDAGISIELPTKWKFSIKLDEAEAKIYLKLMEKPKDQQEVFAAFEVSIKKEDGTEFAGLVCGVREYGLNSDWLRTTDEPIPSVDDDDDDEDDFLINGSLVMEIKFELFGFGKPDDGGVINVEKHSRNNILQFREKSMKATLDDFQKLLDQGHESDVKIVTKDGKEFLVHKNILASRSPVFWTMFKSNLEEASSGVVQVPDLSADAMEIVLKFIYSGKVDDAWKEVTHELVYAAEKYSLELLKEFCDTMIFKTATAENFIELLKLARKFNLKTAKKELTDYAYQNFSRVVDAATFV